MQNKLIKTKKLLSGLVIFSLVLSILPFPLSQVEAQDDAVNVRVTQIISKDFPEIQAYVSVEDESGNTISGLTADNFEVTEQSNLENQPTIETPIDVDFVAGYSAIAVALVIDRSGSMGYDWWTGENKMEDAKNSAKNFLELLHYSEGDRAGVVSFSSSVRIDQPFTSNKDNLTSAVDSLSASGWTALYDAIYTAITETAKETGVKAVIVFTDGQENRSTHTKDEVISHANSNNIPVYTIGLGSDADEGPLKEIASSTHAFYKFAPQASDLEVIYNDIAQKQKGQYLVAYTTHNPNFDGTTRAVTVKATVGANSGQGTGTYLVGTETTAPQITLTDETKQLMAVSQFARQDLEISATISDDVSVQEAKLFYRTTNSGEPYKEVLMNNPSGDLYQYTIQGSDVQTPGIDFYITASDGTYVSTEPKYRPSLVPHQIAILPNNKPVITHAPVTEVPINVSIEINASIVDTDDNDYVGWAKVYYRKGGHILYQSIDMSNLSEDHWYGVIPEDVITPDGIDYYIVASDSRGVKAYDGTDVNPYHITSVALPTPGGPGQPIFDIDYNEIPLGNALSTASAISQEPINLAIGNYIFQRTDFVIPGRGLPFVFQRTYNSSDSYNGPLGYGWTHSYNVFLLENPDGTVKVKYEDGHAAYFKPIGGGNYQSKYGGVYDTLIKNPDDTFTLTKKNQIKYQFNSSGKLTSIEDKNGNKISLQYDAFPNLVEITDTVGRKISFQYGNNNKISEIWDPAGRVVRFSYDGNDNLISTTDSEGYTTTFTYDSNHKVDIITDPRGNIIIDNDYDSEGRVIKQTNGRGYFWTYEYSTSTSEIITTETDAKGNKTTYVHDLKYRLIKETDAKGNFITYTYDNDNNRTSITDKNGNTYNFTYDANGNLLSNTDPLGNTATFEYDANNNLIKSTAPSGNITTYEYDYNGNLISITNALGNKTTISYNGFGQPTAITDANGNSITNTYDSKGNLIKITDAEGNFTTYTFDEIGRRTGLTDPKGNTSYFYYDNRENLMAVKDALGKITEYLYDENNNRIKVKDANQNEITYTYDANNLLTSIKDSENYTTSFQYDENDNRISATDPNGNLINYSYDSLNNLNTISYPNGSLVKFNYDANGNGIEMVDVLGTTLYQYDALNRLTQVTDSNNKAVQYSYNSNGLLTTLTYPDGKKVEYTYDNLGRLIKIKDWLNGEITYSYDSVGNLISTTYPNGIETIYNYDSANRLIGLGHVKQNRGTFSGSGYQYDANGNIIKTIPINPVIPTLKAGITNYSYQNNKLIQAGNDNFTYDANGNLIKKETPEGVINYNYDFQDDLIKVEDSQGNITEYKYDGEQNRIATIYNGSTTNYVLDRNSQLTWVLAETDENGEITKYYVYGLGLISQISPDGKALYYHYDNIGNTIALTDENGNITDEYSYEAFGQIASQTGTTENPFKYVGRYGVMEEKNGLMFMRERYYDSEVGRFIEFDPLKNLAGYIYVVNNPIIIIDPLGLDAITISGSISLFVQGGIGISIGSEGIYFHFTTGIGIPGIGGSVMYSPSNPKVGWSDVTGKIGTPWFVGGEFEVSEKGEELWWEYVKKQGKIGVTTPGASAMKTRTWQLFKWPWEKEEKKKLDWE